MTEWEQVAYYGRHRDLKGAGIMKPGVVRQLDDHEVARIVLVTGNLPDPIDPGNTYVMGFVYDSDDAQQWYARRNRKLGHQVFPLSWAGKPVDIVYARFRPSRQR